MNGSSEFLDVNEKAALERAQKLASLFDDAIEIPVIGVKVGIDPILGVLPVSGDLVSGLLSLYIPAEAVRLGVPMTTVFRMLLNIGLDVAIGSIPVLGSVFDAFWKANRRNVTLLEEFVEGGTNVEIEDENEQIAETD